MSVKEGEKTVLQVTVFSKMITSFPAYHLLLDCGKTVPRLQTGSKDLSKLERCPMPHQYGPESLLRYTEALCVLGMDYRRTQKGIVGLLG